MYKGVECCLWLETRDAIGQVVIKGQNMFGLPHC